MILYNLIFPYDHIILVITFIFIFFSFWKGFISSILSLLTWVGSILITIYTYDVISLFLSKQILKINFFNNLEYLTSIISIFITIPLIFVIILFILRKIRKFITADIDNQTFFAVLLDKIFGIIYGIAFSYIFISATLITINHLNYNPIIEWYQQNSYILYNIEKINLKNINFINLSNYNI